VDDLTGAARKASRSDLLEGGARLGLAARGTIYLLMGLLALGLARGTSQSETDQRGALRAVASHSGGKVLLVVLAVGFAGYALWRFSEAAFGVVGDGNGAGPRLKSAARGIVYAVFAVTTVSLLTGGGSGSQGQQQQDLTARVMGHSGGRWLVGLAGVVVLVIGATMVYEGATKKFEKYLRMSDMSARTRSAVEKLGMVGTIARGVVIGLAGLLVIDAARTIRPDKARGVDGALRTLAAQGHGKVLLVVVALGLVCFGVYGYAEARWHRT
jgi:hypothetical protein